MNVKVLSFVFFIVLLFPLNIAGQSQIMVIHKSNGHVVQHNLSEIDSVTFEVPVYYTPTFKSTNITSGAWDGFAEYGNRLFATNSIYGILEYKNGKWESADEIPEAGLSYPIVKEVAGRLIIACPLGILMQSGDDNYHWALWYTTSDYAGALGGSSTNFFAGAGTNGKGIFRWNGGDYFSVTNEIDGCWYSIEALNENTVFFGAGATHVSPANYGIKRWDNDRQEVVNTNMEYGVFILTPYNNKMYATGGTSSNSVYVWNGSSFDQIRSGDKLRVAGSDLYCFAPEGVLRYNSSSNSFETFASKDMGSFSEIAEYQNFIYLFGQKTIAFNKNTRNWINVECDFGNIDIATVTRHGLFVSHNISGSGIQVMVPVYQ